jgi:hypothetical protein
MQSLLGQTMGASNCLIAWICLAHFAVKFFPCRKDRGEPPPGTHSEPGQGGQGGSVLSIPR